ARTMRMSTTMSTSTSEKPPSRRPPPVSVICACLLQSAPRIYETTMPRSSRTGASSDPLDPRGSVVGAAGAEVIRGEVVELHVGVVGLAEGAVVGEEPVRVP